MKKFKIGSIKLKLIVYFTILVLISSSAIGVLSIQRSSEIITNEAEEALLDLAEEASKLTVSRIETQQRTLDMIALIPDINSMNWEIQKPVLENQLSNTNFLAMAVVYPDGNAYYSDGKVSQLGDRDYVQKALNGQANVSDLILSKVTNEIVLMYASPIKKDGQVVGALIGRSDGNALSIITDDTGFGENGYGFMINKAGTVVAHPDREKVMNQFNPIESVKSDESLTSLANLINKVLDEKTGVSNYTFDGNDLYAGYYDINEGVWQFLLNQINMD